MKYNLLILSLLIVAASCTKVEVPKSKQDMLRGDNTKWRMKTGTGIIKYDSRRSPRLADRSNDFPMPVCFEDDRLIFREGNEGAHIPGENICSINETPEIGFRWGLTDNDTKMYIYDAKEYFDMDVNADVVEIFEDRFVIRVTNVKAVMETPASSPAVPYYDTTEYTFEFVSK